MGKRRGGPGFVHRYMGPEILEELLAQGGSPCSAGEAIELLRDGLAEGRSPSDLLPDLFEGEPHFSSPDAARLTFENLLGLCDLLRSGRPLPEGKAKKPARPVREEAPPPGPFPEGGPDEDWVERAWRHLDDLGERERTRREHAFENRQDALLVHLDDSGLSDDGYLAARHLLFELHAMLELGWPKGLASASDKALAPTGGARDAPAALLAYVDEALFEAEQDEGAPLPPAEAARARDVVGRGLAAMWSARRR